MREAKASKPERWQIPTDLSLKNYLKKAATNSDSHNQTLTSTAVTNNLNETAASNQVRICVHILN